MTDTLKEIIGFTLLAIALGFAFFISARTGYNNLFPEKEVAREEQLATEEPLECNDNQYEENGECKDKGYVCPNGEKVSDSSYCPKEIMITSSSTATTTTPQSPITKATTSVTTVEDKRPTIKNVTITPNGKGILVAVIGTNFDKKVNTVTLSSQGQLVETMTFPAYPGSNNMQTINFRMTDFREHYNNKYSFQISVKGKNSNVFKVNE